MAGEDKAQKVGLDDLLRSARAHGQLTDTPQRIADLEQLLSAAWELMDDQQRATFLAHPEVLAVAEAAGER